MNSIRNKAKSAKRNQKSEFTTKRGAPDDTADIIMDYDRNSLCSIFEAVDRYRFIKKYGSLPTTVK